jgi:crotonobetainyl-CoA:carnitine CoA-transferase CaiB-like acyl-CoA transferase
MITVGPGRPLEGVKVLDMAEEKGELCGRLLADLGAEVLRAEPPGGSASRRLPPYAPDGTSLFFAHRNANKRGIVIDPAADGDAMRDLLGWADVWIETTEPGSLAAAGLHPAEVSRRYPQLVVLSLTDFGQTGPYRNYHGTDPVLVAMSGMLFRSGRPDRPPLLPPGMLAYDTASVTACFAVLSALWLRRGTGQGAHLDLSVMEAAAQAADWSLPNTSFLQRLGAPVVETRDGSGNVYPLYRCADGYVRLIVLSPRQWRSLCEWMDAPEWLRDPHWEQPMNRAEITDVLETQIGGHFAPMSRLAAAEEGQRRGVAVTPVLRPHDVLHAPHFAERGTFTTAEIAPGLTAPAFAGFMGWDGTRLGIRRRAPRVDEDREQVLAAARAAAGAAARRDAGSPASTGPARPFSGLRVVDFGIGGVGVEAGRMLADYGADVIKIEGRGYPDFMRIIGGTEMTPSFASSSRGKRSLGVNLKSAAGVAVVRRLIAASDVVIENSAAGALDRVGLSWDACRAVNPRLVYVSSQLMGRQGPWSRWIGYGPSTRPPSGLTYLWNYDDDPEGMPPGSRAIYPDHLVGRMCAVAAVTGLLARERTGHGCHVEVAQVEITIGMIADLLTQEALAAGSVKPQGNHSQRGAPWGVYPCAGEEQWCVITVTDDAAWRALRAAMGEPDWAADRRLDTAAGRLARQADLDERVAAWTRTQDARQLTETLQARGVPAGFLMYSSAMTDDPHLRARGFPLPVSQPGVGEFIMEGPAFHSPSITDPTGVPAPGLGADTCDICRGVLGMGDDEIRELVRTGVLEADTAAVLNAD